jgi:hypothetical protein
MYTRGFCPQRRVNQSDSVFAAVRRTAAKYHGMR